jgi:hypothetical protein
MDNNPQWREMRNHLFESGARCLWQLCQSEMPEGVSFSLECFATNQGVTIFQIWKDCGIAIFTDNSPKNLEDCKEWLSPSS